METLRISKSSITKSLGTPAEPTPLCKGKWVKHSLYGKEYIFDQPVSDCHGKCTKCKHRRK